MTLSQALEKQLHDLSRAYDCGLVDDLYFEIVEEIDETLELLKKETHYAY